MGRDGGKEKNLKSGEINKLWRERESSPWAAARLEEVVRAHEGQRGRALESIRRRLELI